MDGNRRGGMGLPPPPGMGFNDMNGGGGFIDPMYQMMEVSQSTSQCYIPMRFSRTFEMYDAAALCTLYLTRAHASSGVPLVTISPGSEMK